MNLRQTFALLALAVALLLAAVLIRSLALWSALANHTVPWFCSALAIAVLLVVLASLLTGRQPGKIPPAVAWWVTGGTSAALGIGMIIDAQNYQIALRDAGASIAEWAGITAIVGSLFILSQLWSTTEAKDSESDEAQSDT